VSQADGDERITYNSWTLDVSVSDADFQSLSENDTEFLHLAAESDMIDAGTDIGLSFEGTSPDLGAYEYKGDTSEMTTDAAVRVYDGSSWEAATVKFHDGSEWVSL